MLAPILKRLLQKMAPTLSAEKTQTYLTSDLETITTAVQQYATEHSWTYHSGTSQLDVKTGKLSGKTLFYKTGLVENRSQVKISIVLLKEMATVTVNASVGDSKFYGSFDDGLFFDRLAEAVLGYLSLTLQRQ